MTTRQIVSGLHRHRQFELINGSRHSRKAKYWVASAGAPRMSSPGYASAGAIARPVERGVDADDDGSSCSRTARAKNQGTSSAAV